MEMEKQVFSNVPWATQRSWDTERNFNKQTLLGSSLSMHLVHTIVIHGDISLPGTGPLFAFFQAVRGKVNISS